MKATTNLMSEDIIRSFLCIGHAKELTNGNIRYTGRKKILSTFYGMVFYMPSLLHPVVHFFFLHTLQIGTTYFSFLEITIWEGRYHFSISDDDDDLNL